MTPKAEEKRVVKPQPQPTPSPAPAPAVAVPVAAATIPSKQTATLEQLKTAWTKAGVDLKTLKATPDGKNMVVVVGPEWPDIVIGPGGGIDIPALKSFPKAFDAALDAKALLAKQVARTQKKTAPATPKPQTAVGKQPGKIDGDTGKVVEKETQTAKKARAHGQIEQRLQAQA